MFTAAQFTIAKTWNQPKCPSMIDWTGKMWHIYTMEYYAAIKNDEFMSFVGRWINRETIILSKLTQETENEIPHVLTHRQVLNNENTWTQGGEHYTLESVLGNREGQQGVGSWGEIALGEIANVDDGVMDVANHHVTCMTM